MWYALMDMQNTEDYLLWLAYGTLQDIAEAVLEQCEFCDPSGKNTLDIDKLFASGYEFQADDYLALKSADSIIADMLKNFEFVLSDTVISIYGLSDNYADFKRAFESYSGRGQWFVKKLKLPNMVSVEEEMEFAKELWNILFEPEEFLYCPSYVTKYIPRISDEDL